jgi:hypothetical protein
MADQLPAHDPLVPLHGPLREDKIPSEWRRQRRAARGQIPTALGAAPGPTGPAGSGRICPLRTDHLGEVEANDGKRHRGWLLIRFDDPIMAIVIVDGSFWCLHDPDKGTSMPWGRPPQPE